MQFAAAQRALTRASTAFVGLTRSASVLARRDQFVQQFELLRRQLYVQSGDARDIAAWSIETGDETRLDS
jgi:hypothetical protein